MLDDVDADDGVEPSCGFYDLDGTLQQANVLRPERGAGLVVEVDIVGVELDGAGADVAEELELPARAGPDLQNLGALAEIRQD